MANRYRVGGTGTWDATDTSHWSATSGGVGGASVPTSADDVIVDANSGGGTLTFNGALLAKSFTTTGYTGGTAYTAGSLTISGNITLGSSMTTNLIAQVNVAANCTLTSSGKAISTLQVQSSAVLTQADAMAVTNSFTVLQGTWVSNNFSSVIGSFSSSNTNTRTLTLGSSNITLTSSGTNSLDFTTSTNLTITANTATFNFTGGAGRIAGNVNYNGASVVMTGAGVPQVNGVITCVNFTRTGTAAKTDGLSLGNTGFTATGTLTLASNSDVNRLIVQSNLTGSARTITAANVVITNTVDFTDIVGAGAATWTVAGTGATALGDAGGNSGITFTSGITCYWSRNTGSSSDATKWAGVPIPAWTAGGVGGNLLGAQSASVETDLSGFEGGFQSTMARSNAQASDGSWSLALTCTVAGFMDVKTIRPVVTAGQHYTATVRFRAATVARACKIVLRWRDSGGSIISDTDPSTLITNSTSVWTEAAVSGVAPAGAVAVQLVPTVTSPAVSEVHYIDALALRSTAGARVPLPQDDVRFDASSFTLASQTVTTDMPRMGKDINWTGSTNNPTWTFTNAPTMYGSLVLIAAMMMTATGGFFVAGRGSHTIMSNGKQVSTQISVQGPGGTYTLSDALNIVTALAVSAGTFNSANFSISCSTFVFTGTLTRSVLFGTSTMSLTATTGVVWNVAGSGLTLSAASSTIVVSTASASARTINGFGGSTIGTLTYTVVASTGALVFSSLDIGTLNVSGGRTITFAGGTVNVTTPNISGSVGNLLTLNASPAGSPKSLNKVGGGTVGTDYLSIQDITASPGSTWYAGSHSTNVSGNSGWIFADLVLVSGVQATESDTGNSGLVTVLLPGSQASESDTANAGTALVRPSGSEADESDTAISGLTEARPLGSEADESDTGSSGLAEVRLPGTQASESDTTSTGAALVRPQGSQASESDTAIAGSLGLVVNLEPYPGEPSDISIPILLSGYLDAVFPPPAPPIDFPGLPNPTVAPALTQDNEVEGYLPSGTYRYRYAAWKGTPSQATAPSPSADITLVPEGVSSVYVWTAEDISGSETSQPNLPTGLWKQIGTWTPTESGSLTVPFPIDDEVSYEIDYLIYDASDVRNWGLWDSYGYWTDTRPIGHWESYTDTDLFDAGTEYVLAVYVWNTGDQLSAVGRSTNFAPFVEAVQAFGEPIITVGETSDRTAVSLTYPTIPGADGYLVYREEL